MTEHEMPLGKHCRRPQPTGATAIAAAGVIPGSGPGPSAPGRLGPWRKPPRATSPPTRGPEFPGWQWSPDASPVAPLKNKALKPNRKNAAGGQRMSSGLLRTFSPGRQPPVSLDGWVHDVQSFIKGGVERVPSLVRQGPVPAGSIQIR